jgi:hypothetical protein
LLSEFRADHGKSAYRIIEALAAIEQHSCERALRRKIPGFQPREGSAFGIGKVD